jgi:hypothetical protein
MDAQMTPLLGRIKNRVLGLSLDEASFDRHGFPGSGSPSRAHLEHVIHTFIMGYNTALHEADLSRLVHRLDSSFEPGFVGFAYEGAGLYFAVTDLLIPRAQSRLAAFTNGPGQRHDFIAAVGAGFAIARAPFGLRRLAGYQAKLHPMIAWCLADGYGFHQAFFDWKRFVEGGQIAPASFSPQNRALFDAGVGRAMWWVFGADPSSIAAAISRADGHRQAEMWTGLGTALAYAAGGPPGASTTLETLAGTYRLDLLSGICLAAHMRDKGRNPATWTDDICRESLNRTVTEASYLVIGELTLYLDSWQGSDRDKWARCYLALRDRLKKRLAADRPDADTPSSVPAARPQHRPFAVKPTQPVAAQSGARR